MLMPLTETGCCEAVLEKGPVGLQTPPSHATSNQFTWWFLQGDSPWVVRPAICGGGVLHPKTRAHVANTGRKELQYLSSSLARGIPDRESEGGWKSVYQRMIQEYADRGTRLIRSIVDEGFSDVRPDERRALVFGTTASGGHCVGFCLVAGCGRREPQEAEVQKTAGEIRTWAENRLRSPQTSAKGRSPTGVERCVRDGRS